MSCLNSASLAKAIRASVNKGRVLLSLGAGELGLVATTAWLAGMVSLVSTFTIMVQ